LRCWCPSGSFGRWPAQATSEVWPAALGAGASFGVVQFLVSNFIGPELVGILASLASIGSLLLHLQRQRQRPRPRHGGRQGPAGGRQAVADGRRVRLESEVGG